MGFDQLIMRHEILVKLNSYLDMLSEKSFLKESIKSSPYYTARKKGDTLLTGLEIC